MTEPMYHRLASLFTEAEAVLFDMDGTLLDSMRMWRDIDVRFLAERGLPMRPDLQKCIEGISMPQVAVWFQEEYGLTESVDEIMSIWNRMAEEAYARSIDMKPGAAGFIRQLADAGVPMAIATSNSRPLAEAAVHRHPALGHVRALVTSNEVTTGKPAPDVYLYAASQLGIEPARCVVLEDILPGIVAGKNAGMRVIAVEDDYSASIRFEKEQAADAYAENYDVLTDAFRRARRIGLPHMDRAMTGEPGKR